MLHTLSNTESSKDDVTKFLFLIIVVVVAEYFFQAIYHALIYESFDYQLLSALSQEACNVTAK